MPELNLPEEAEGIVRWFCPVCGLDITGSTYNIDEGRKKCSKTWHKSIAVKRGFVTIESLPAIRKQERERVLAKAAEELEQRGRRITGGAAATIDAYHDAASHCRELALEDSK